MPQQSFRYGTNTALSTTFKNGTIPITLPGGQPPGNVSPPGTPPNGAQPLPLGPGATRLPGSQPPVRPFK